MVTAASVVEYSLARLGCTGVGIAYHTLPLFHIEVFAYQQYNLLRELSYKLYPKL